MPPPAAAFSLWLSALAVAAAGIWAHDLTWLTSWQDALPAIAAIPLFWHLGRPWQQRSQPLPVSWKGVAVAALLMACGAAADMMMLSAVGWSVLLGCVLHAHVQSNAESRWPRLMGLAVLGFPWIVFDAQAVGWWFRWTAAAAAEAALLALQADVWRQGTELWIGQHCVSVGQACAGLKGLQAMLVGGTLMAYWTLGRVRSGYWWHLPVLLAGAWAANALRVLLTAIGVAWLPPDWVQGDAHLWQGWLLLLLAFVGCGIWMRRWEAAKHIPEPG